MVAAGLLSACNDSTPEQEATNMALAAIAFAKFTLFPLKIIQHRFTMSLFKNLTCSKVPIAGTLCFSDEPKFCTTATDMGFVD
jgi:hypothetical protein